MKYENIPEYPMTTYGTEEKRIRKRVQRIRLPHFTSVEWTEQNPLLQKGEIAVESDTRRMKIGTGVARWNDLEYIAGSSGGANVAWGEISGTLTQQKDLTDALADKIDKQQGAENSGKVLVVGDDGEVTLGEVSGGGSTGGLAEVAHDDSLTGKGTTASPLKVSNSIKNSISEKASTTYVDNQIAAVVTGYENADKQIKSSITTLSGTVSTLRTDHDDLGDQVSSIEGKIPETATEYNQLSTVKDLDTAIFDLKVEIAGDISDATSPIQTQVEGISAEVAKKQDKLTAGANIVIIDNVISATGGGGGGEGGITSVVHDSSMTGMGTATSPLGIDTTYLDTAISTNAVVTDTKSTAFQAQTTANDAYAAVKGKQDIIDGSSYVTAYSVNATEMGVGNIYITQYIEGPDAYFDNFHATYAIETPELTIGTGEGTLNVSIAAGTATIATNNGLDIAAQTKFDTAPTTDDTTAWANVNATALVTKAQVTTALGTVSGGLTEVTAGEGLKGNGTSGNPLTIDTAFLDTTISANNTVSTANQEAMSARSEAAQALTLAQANEQALANKQEKGDYATTTALGGVEQIALQAQTAAANAQTTAGALQMDAEMYKPVWDASITNGSDAGIMGSGGNIMNILWCADEAEAIQKSSSNPSALCFFPAVTE